MSAAPIADVDAWWAERCEFAAGAVMHTDDLRADYVAWSAGRGERPTLDSVFRGYVVGKAEKSTDPNMLVGLRLRRTP